MRGVMRWGARAAVVLAIAIGGARSFEAAAAEPTAAEKRWGLTFTTATGGARIAAIDPQSPAAWSLRKDDVVLTADASPVRDPEQIVAYLAAVPDGRPVLLELRRAGRTRMVGVQIPGAPPTGPAPTSVFPPGVGDPPPPAPAPPVIVYQAPSGNGEQAPLVPWGWGGGADFGWWPPPSFSAPGRPEIPGATFPPGPGLPPQAAPQLPGIAQPPGFRVPLTPIPPGFGPPGAPGERAQVAPAPPPPGLRPPPGPLGAAPPPAMPAMPAPRAPGPVMAPAPR